MKTKNDAGEQLLSAWLTLSSTLWNERIVTGMTFNEAFVCNLLSRQDAAQPLTATDLCQRTKLLKSQMNKVLSDMERKGYIQRIRSEKDKRQVLLHLTEAGQAAYAKEHSGISAILHHLVEDLGEEKALHAADIVEEITQSLKKIEIL